MRIFGYRREEAVGGWRRLHSEELHNFYALPNVIRVIRSRTMRCVGAGSTHGRDEKCTQNFGQKLLERPRCRWEDNIGMDLIEMGWGGVEWMHLVQDRE
jgi:hypothetical protein